jgi:hypothetical protein
MGVEHLEGMMSYLPYKPVRALSYALLFWVVLVPWAAYVATTPALAQVPGIPLIANNYIISLPTLLVWSIMAFLLARHYLRTARHKPIEGLKLGLTFAVISFVLDLVVIAGLVGVGSRHFAQLVVWIGYLALIIIPWWVGTRQTEQEV